MSSKLPSSVVLCCLYALATISGLQQQFSYHNRVLLSTVVPWKQVEVLSWLQCLQKCSVNNECIAYVIGFSDNRLSCQLYSRGFQNSCHTEKQLSERSGYLFHQMKQTQVECLLKDGSLSATNLQISFSLPPWASQKLMWPVWRGFSVLNWKRFNLNIINFTFFYLYIFLVLAKEFMLL